MDVHHVITPGDHYSPRTGSAIPTVVHGLASGARTAGDAGRYPQRVVLQADTFRPRYDSADLLEYDGVPAPGRREWYADVLRGRMGLARRGAERYFAPAVARLRREAPGLVLAHNAPIVPWLLSDSAHRSVLYAHNDLLRSYSRAEATRIVGAADRVVCVSEALAAQMRAHLPRTLHDRVRVVGNGIDTAAFSPAAERLPGPPRVMFLGRAIPEKGADILLAAAARIRREDVEYVIVGSRGFDSGAALSPYENRLRELAARVPGTVRFEPFVARAELPALLRTADVLVLPSRWPEPWALTVGEGLATGLPVIAARRGGIPEALGDAGILFDPDRPAELADAIAALVEDPARRRALGGQARRSALARDWTWAWSHLAAVLDELADRTG
ncbi:glycosyltransferase family 4 protein [Microbacterium rhizophilus]|uniref:glycosyltransferase family 4 protein n=1 Tax=Microbacterium rhizophilus TaxID=3138934 RepID=UPI0031E8880C